MLLTDLAELVLPRHCVACGARGAGWCRRCRAGCVRAERLPRASRLAGIGVYSLAEYAGSARTAVVAYKERNRRDLAAELAEVYLAGLLDLLAESLNETERRGPICLIPVPSGRRASALRGGAHMSRLAQRIAALAAQRIPVVTAEPLLLTSGVRDSVGLDARARSANLFDHLRVRDDALPHAQTIPVLLDDVVTTGATATACTRALHAAGRRPLAMLALTSPMRG